MRKNNTYKSKKKMTIILIIVALILVATVGITYAFLTVTVTGEKQHIIKAGTLLLTLDEDDNNLQITNAYPMYDEVGMIQDPYTFRLVNNSQDTVHYTLNLINETPAEVETEQKCSELEEITKNSPKSCRKLTYPDKLREESLAYWKYMLEEMSLDSINTEEDCVYTFKKSLLGLMAGKGVDSFEDLIDLAVDMDLEEVFSLGDTREVVEVYPDNYVTKSFPSLIFDLKYGLTKDGMTTIKSLLMDSLFDIMDNMSLTFDSGYIKGGQTIDYEFRLWIDSSVEDNKGGYSSSFKIDVEVEQVEGTAIAGMMQPLKNNQTEAFWKYKKNITSIIFENNISIPENGVVESWDVSANQDESVMAYIEDDGNGSGTYKLHIQGNEKIYANEDSKKYFVSFAKLKKIEGLEYFDTSKVINMRFMFYNCSSLTELNLSSFDTSNVTDMAYMFSGCSSLTELDLSSFDTSKVTNMSYMFNNASKLTSELKIIGNNCTTYENMFNSTSTASGSSFTVYGDGTNEELINNMIGTKSVQSNIIYGGVK